MIDEAIKSQIVGNLVRRRSKNSIITALCESSDLRWVEAKRLVDEIEENNSLEIYSRQKPFMIILGSMIALGGCILSGFILYETLTGLIVFVGIVPIPYFGNIFLFGLGLGMLIGGSRGVIKLLMD
ncbi:MAG: hypothetical protein K8R16_13540 [Anaerolineales bacterium]|nr:hypothetical protein [Anaerolineales bacterium]